jgi:hypothetical protein
MGAARLLVVIAAAAVALACGMALGYLWFLRQDNADGGGNGGEDDR